MTVELVVLSCQNWSYGYVLKTGMLLDGLADEWKV